MKTIRLQESSFGSEEINEALDSMKSTNVVMGEKCKLFESEWNKWQDSNYSIFVNSGSSANLLIISLLKSKRGNYQLINGDEILIPAVTWSTTLSPILQLGLKPILVDVNPKTFNISINSCKNLVTERTKAIFVVHLLGNPCNMDEIIKFTKEYNLLIIEDCCEAHGEKWKGTKVGNFGVASSFSFMFAHHMTTIEGGMICCKNNLDNKILKALRAHGWIREFTLHEKSEVIKEYSPDDERFFFWESGYNCRPTEINGAFGFHQLRKINKFIEIRNRNFELYLEKIKPIKDIIQVQELEDNIYSERSNYAFGFYVKDEKFNRKQLIKHLENNGIESRPVVAGNLARHPFYKLYCDTNYAKEELEVSDLIHNNGLYLPNHQALTEEDINYVSSKLVEFFRNEI